MSAKERLSATVDADLLAAGRAAVQAGQFDSLSAWVNAGISRQVEHDRRLASFDEFLAEYEAEHGEITEAEMDAAERNMRARAIVVRGKGSIVSSSDRARGVA